MSGQPCGCDPEANWSCEDPNCAWKRFIKSEERICPRPPVGWVCTRNVGHEGPCAVVQYLAPGQLLPQVPAGSPMDEAWGLTHGDRRAAYGSPAQVFAGYAMAWSAIIARKLQPGIVLDATDVTLMMTALKLCREANSPKRDNTVDAHGYLVIHDEIKGE